MDDRGKNIRRRVNTPNADQSTTDPLLRQTQTQDEVSCRVLFAYIRAQKNICTHTPLI